MDVLWVGDVSIPPAFILYAIALFTWGLIELDAALKKKKGMNFEESLSIATNLDARISRRWLAIILTANGVVSLFSFLMVECIISENDGCYEGVVELVLFNAIWPAIGSLALAGFLIFRLPDLRGTKDWAATVSIGFLSVMNTLILISMMVLESQVAYLEMFPAIFSAIGGTTWRFK